MKTLPDSFGAINENIFYYSIYFYKDKIRESDMIIDWALL